jgi:hypothetical protein
MHASGNNGTSVAGDIFAFVAAPLVIMAGLIFITDWRGIASWHAGKVREFGERVPWLPQGGASYRTMGVIFILFGMAVIVLGFYGLAGTR